MSTLRVSVCGIDPGKTTGFFAATLYLNSDNPVRMSSPIVRHLRRDEVRPAVELQFEVEPTTSVGVERYVITQRTVKLSRQPDALEVTGVVRDVCQLRNATCVLQMKSDAAKAAPDDLLKRIGWHVRGMKHGNDAARQAYHLLSSVAPLALVQLWKRGIIIAGSEVRFPDEEEKTFGVH